MQIAMDAIGYPKLEDGVSKWDPHIFCKNITSENKVVFITFEKHSFKAVVI